jgi:hypothetical protein
MPIWLRRFTFQKLKDHYDEMNDKNKQWNRAQNSQKPKIQRPAIDPSYTTKTSPK